MTRILVTGSDGQVGKELQNLTRQFPLFEFRFTNRTTLDITDSVGVNRYVNSYLPDFILNCAAYTAVDRAETDTSRAASINIEGPLVLASAAKKYGAKLLHLSTDYVYHNDWNRPLTEDAPTHPQSVYAKTKLDGEHITRQVLGDDVLVVRTSWVYSSFGHNFVKTMLSLAQKRDALNVVDDQIGSPTFAGDLANALLQLCAQSDKWGGIYHYSNEGVCSWYDFAHAIFALTDTPMKLTPIPSSQYPTPAARPPFSVLNKGKIRETFGLSIPHWRESLAVCLELLEVETNV